MASQYRVQKIIKMRSEDTGSIQARNFKQRRSGGEESMDFPEEKNDERDTQSRKEGPHGLGDCDPSILVHGRGKHRMLQIFTLLDSRNKGNGPLNRYIFSASQILFNWRKQRSNPTKEKDDNKAGKGQCKLDIKDTIAHYSGTELHKSHESADI
ncbi:hypothetical protein NC653_001056 [Populus alba x Populus x berolinensis]|uniref:Uncharacterized protein n=1 Tax=Populus alba x Populus x berolinensis TaxID=444605 RepID=A0AAD6WFJ2_9ROSI|nr:hypothetical protein NC653_001056 [Populus alba x Populus x berolinensis]